MNINKQLRLLHLWRKTFNTSDFDEWLNGMTSFIGRRTKENIIIADDSDNLLRGGHANDLLLAGNGKDIANGGKGNDILVGDKLPSADDYNTDGSTFYTPSKNHDQSDTLRGGLGNDLLINQFGSDYYFGGRGNDRLVSLSDSGIPTGNNIEILDDDSTENQLSQLDFSVSNINPNSLASNDILKGGRGADTFEFQLLINARKEIVDKHTDADTGEINWGMGGVAGENENFHDHWVDGIGNDTILDFNSRQGDLIKISGHTVQAILLENDSTNKEALIGVYSDQGADGKRTGGAHDLDVLGTVKVHYRGKFDFDSDVVIEQKDYGAYGANSNVAAEIGSNNELLNESSTFKIFGNSGDNVLIGDSGENRIKGFAGDDKMIGNPGDDRLFGGAGIDHLVGDRESSKDDFDGQGYLIADQQASYNDRLSGGSEDDLLVDQYGSDRYIGGTGNDRIVSLSDSSVPGENKSLPANEDDGNDLDKLDFSKEYYNPGGHSANDVLTGGEGADVFDWRLLINASKDIVAKHTNANTGEINWGMGGVAGENANYHDHWVDGIGRDKITDFSGIGGEGDQILIQGHTVQALLISSSSNSALIGVYSDQGADGERGGGAHDLDVLGVIRVNHDGNFSFDQDVTVKGEDFGAYGPGSKLDDVWV